MYELLKQIRAFSTLPVIAEVAKEKGIRPSSPIF